MARSWPGPDQAKPGSIFLEMILLLNIEVVIMLLVLFIFSP
jgi:hypothetical protein